jgi:hypothetical protein
MGFFPQTSLKLCHRICKSLSRFLLVWGQRRFCFFRAGLAKPFECHCMAGTAPTAPEWPPPDAQKDPDKFQFPAPGRFYRDLLSVPFLPPVDGGSRFYAATMPFFFALLVAGLGRFLRGDQHQMKHDEYLPGSLEVSRYASIILLAVVLLVPLVIYRTTIQPATPTLTCPAEEQPFVIEAHRGSYIGLIGNSSGQCGVLPQVCLKDFVNNNIQFTIDDFYQELAAFAGSEGGDFRLIPTLNLVNNDFRYFLLPLNKLPRHGNSELIAGCGVESRTKNQSIFEVKSVLSNSE